MKFKVKSAALLVSVFLAGCAGMTSRPFMEPSIPANLPDVPAPTDKAIGSDKVKELEVDVTDASDAFFVLVPMGGSDPLPAINVSNISVTDQALPDVLKLLGARFGIPVSVRGSPLYGQMPTVSAHHLNGTLESVIEELGSSAGAWITYQRGVMRLEYEKQFLVHLPPMVGDDTITGIANTMLSFGATSLNLDRVGRTVSFRANRAAHEQVDAYLKWLRENRPLIIYDAQVLQVTLSDQSSFGVSWDNLGTKTFGNGSTFTGGAKGPSALTGGAGPGFSAVYQKGSLNMSLLLEFLRSQGSVSTISQPRIAMLAGSSGLIKQGQVTNYVSEIGSSTLGTSATSTTAKTSQVSTGLDLYINGEFHDSTVYSRINLVLAELLRFNDFTVPGTSTTSPSKLSLPQTANREIKTEIRARPGDTILLGGISASRNVNDITGLPGVSGANPIAVPTDISKTAERTELVIVLTPRIVRFAPNAGESKKSLKISQDAFIAATQSQIASGKKQLEDAELRAQKAEEEKAAVERKLRTISQDYLSSQAQVMQLQADKKTAAAKPAASEVVIVVVPEGKDDPRAASQNKAKVTPKASPKTSSKTATKATAKNADAGLDSSEVIVEPGSAK